MSDHRWQRLKALHERVFELPIAEARGIVMRELADDPELAAELISLLEQKLEGTRFLEFDGVRIEPSIFPPHHRLGDYELLHEIGRGGMGYVFMARHLPLERDVALKVLNPTLSNRPEQVDRFRREALRLAQFKSPGIVPIFDVQSIASVHFFAMEYVDGLDLHRELVCLRREVDRDDGRATLPPTDSKDYFRTIAGIVRQAAQALAEAHEHQITHRDVKPHNLILGRDGRLRIVDFGIARDESMGSARAAEEVSGTLFYMSPEQTRLTRRRVVDHRTDIYSLGVVLYELLTLKRPFDGQTQREILKAIEVREARPVRTVNPRVPRELAVICHTAMAKEPGDRYRDARAMAADLGRFLAGEPIEATPPTAVELAQRYLRRHKTAIVAGGLAVLALVAGVYFGDVARADPNQSLVRFDFRGGPGARAPVRLSARYFDPLTERTGAAFDLGRWPVSPELLNVGCVRVRVDYGDDQTNELIRYIPRGRSVTIEVPLARAFSDVGMVLIRGGTLSRRQDPCKTLCSNLGQDIEVEPFYLDAREVTVAEYRRFLRETGRSQPVWWAKYGEDAALDERPVCSIGYHDMLAYAEWRGMRLPTHAEIEWAARGAADRRSPTGAALDGSLRAPIHGEGPRTSASVDSRFELWKLHTQNVGTSPDDVTPEGVFDLLGNVREATASLFVNVLADGGVPQLMPDCYWLVGGAWYSDDPPTGLDAHAFDGTGTPGFSEHGFRCARSVFR